MTPHLLLWALLGLQLWGTGGLAGERPPAPIAAALHQVVTRMQADRITTANVVTRQPQTYSTPLVRVDAQGRIHTAITVTQVDAQIEAALRAHDALIERTEAPLHLIHAWVPFDRLTTLATIPGVRALRPPSYASRR